MPSPRPRRFPDCEPSEQLLTSAFLLLMGIGYLMALIYLYTSHEGHDGKPGLSIEDFVGIRSTRIRW